MTTSATTSDPLRYRATPPHKASAPDPRTHMRPLRATTVLLSMAFLVACTEDASVGTNTPSETAGSGGAAPNGGNAGGGGCAIPAAVLPYLSTCSAAESQICRSAWGSRYDGDSCRGVVGTGECPVEGAAVRCVNLNRGEVTVYGPAYLDLLNGIERDCNAQGGTLCRLP